MTKLEVMDLVVAKKSQMDGIFDEISGAVGSIEIPDAGELAARVAELEAQVVVLQGQVADCQAKIDQIRLIVA